MLMLCLIRTYRLVPCRRMWMCACDRKLTMWMLCLFPAEGRERLNSHDLKIPLALWMKLQGMISEDKILLGMKFWQIRYTNDKLVIGWSMYLDFKRMRLAEHRTMSSRQNNVCVICRAPDDMKIVMETWEIRSEHRVNLTFFVGCPKVTPVYGTFKFIIINLWTCGPPHAAWLIIIIIIITTVLI